MIVVFLGGVSVSGAEKRILETFSMLCNKYTCNVVLYIEKGLYEGIVTGNSESLKRSLGMFDSVHVFGGIGRGRFLRLLSIFYTGVKSFFALRHLRPIPYFCLLSPVYFPLFRFFDKLFFEVTSPDIANMRSLGLAKFLFGSKLKFISVSEGVRDRVNKRLKLSADHIEAISLVRKYPYPPIIVSGDINVDKDNAVVFAHRLIKRKNPYLALSVFKRLAVKYKSWNFFIIGDGPEMQGINAILQKEPIANVFVLGRVDNLKERLAMSKVFVSLIEPDNYPSQSLLEAMALGNALVVSDKGVSKVKFISGNGFAVQLEEESVVVALDKILESDELNKEFIQGSISHYSRNFSLDNYLTETIELINGG